MPLALRRLAVALAGGLLASGGLALGAAPALGAPTAGACTDPAGVTVVVDFGRLGGGVQVRCAPAPVKNGFEALTRAGFSITSVSGQAFLCRIDAKPADDPCNRIPSAARYWSYWHASRGADWTYSSSGASRKPPPGSVEGWAFGGGDEPGAPPPGLITTTTSPPAPPTTSVVAPPGSSATVDTSSPSTSSPTTASTTITVPSTGDAVDDAPPGGDGELVAPALTPTRAVTDDDAASPTGVLVAALLVGSLAVIGVRIVRRRSRDEAAG